MRHGSTHPSSMGSRSSTPAYTLTNTRRTPSRNTTSNADITHTFGTATRHSATGNIPCVTHVCPTIWVTDTMRRLCSIAQASTATSVPTNLLVQLCELTRSEAIAPSAPASELLQMLLDILEVELHEQRTSRFVAPQIKHANEAPPRHSVHQPDSCYGKDGVTRKAVIALDQ